MIRRVCLVTLLLGAGCASREPAREKVTLASLDFDVPATWNRTDGPQLGIDAAMPAWNRPDGSQRSQRGMQAAQWTPPRNERKESITVIYSQRSPAVAKAGTAMLEQLLAASQHSLAKVRASKGSPIKTARGLSGTRIDVDFVPQGVTERYRRVHVVLAAHDDALIHVMYTAGNPDEDLTALSMVLDTIRQEEG